MDSIHPHYPPLLWHHDTTQTDVLPSYITLAHVFKEGLKAVGIYRSFTKFFCPNVYESDVQQLHMQLAEQFRHHLSSVTSSTEIDEVKVALLDRAKLLSIVEHLAADAKELLPEALPQINAILTVLKTNQTEHLNIKEWANLSLMLDNLSAKWKRTSATGDRMRQQFVDKIIDYLKLTARLQSQHLAREKIISLLEAHYQKKWKLGHSHFESYNGSVGVATPFSDLGLSAGINISGNYEKTHAIDDEGYYTEYDLGRGGVSANVRAQVPTTPFATAKASATWTKQGMYGRFGEWASPRAYAIHQFNALIQKSEHRNNPEIARYLTRSSLLASYGLETKLDLELLHDVDEAGEIVGDVTQLKRDFDQRKKDMEQQISVYMRKACTFSPIQVSSSEAIESNVTGYVVELAVNAEARLGLDMDTDDSLALLSGSIAGLGERMVRVRHDQRHTPIGARWIDPLKEEEEKKSIERQLHTQLQIFQKKVSDSWKEEYTQAQKFAGNSATLDVELKKENLALNFNYLKQDFEEYTRLQARMAPSDCHHKYQQDQQVTLRKFEKRYGAITPEQLIHRMAIANAYLLTQTENEQLKADMLAFEQELLSPPFTVDQNYLKKHAYFIEDVNFETTENKLKLEIKLGLPAICKLGQFKFKLNATHTRLEHTNILRRGDYGTFAITIGGEVNIKDVVAQMAPHLYEHIPGDLGAEALELIARDLYLIAPTGSFGVEKMYVWRIARPERFSKDSKEFSLNRYFFRKLDSAFVKMGGQIAIPAGLVDVVIGGEYANIHTDPLKEKCYSNTLFYFATLCMHEYHGNTINKKTGEVAQDSHWKTIIRNQKEALAQLFRNYANGNANLIREIEEIEKAILNNKNYSKQLIAIYGHMPTPEEFCGFSHAKNKFKEAAEEYAAAPSDITYQHALKSIEQLMQAYYPQWIESKNNSANYNPRKLTAVEDTEANLLKQIWQNKLMHLAA